MEKKNNAVSEPPSEIEQDNSEDTSQNILNTPLSAEEVREFLYENDNYIKRFKREITFIKKANFGIPGGDNWIVRLSDGWILIFVINGNRIEKRYVLTSFNPDEQSSFDIMRDIPGKHIGNSSSSFGDFSNDGIDEVFEYGFYGYGKRIIIWGYDLGKDDFISYCEIPFGLMDYHKGPAPVKFMIYQGMYGFKVSFYQGDVAGGPDYVPESHPDNGKWLFYTWDGEQREYVRVGEIIE
jgi:hypothetical protein